MSKDTGGQAFPGPAIHESQEPPYRHIPAEQGVSKREYFAAHALPGIIAAIMVNECHNWNPADFADEAYKIADAMLAERAK